MFLFVSNLEKNIHQFCYQPQKLPFEGQNQYFWFFTKSLVFIQLITLNHIGYFIRQSPAALRFLPRRLHTHSAHCDRSPKPRHYYHQAILFCTLKRFLIQRIIQGSTYYFEEGPKIVNVLVCFSRRQLGFQLVTCEPGAISSVFLGQHSYTPAICSFARERDFVLNMHFKCFFYASKTGLFS